MLKAAMSSLLPLPVSQPSSPLQSAPAHGLPAEHLHLLVVEAHADINALLRVLEPFAVLGVTPQAFRGEMKGNMLRVNLEFMAQADVAENLHRRISAMVMVHHAHLEASAPATADRI